MLRRLLFISLPFLFFACTTQQINDTLNTVLSGNLSSADIANGLKEALRQGAQKGSSELSVEGGYFNDVAYRILLPEEVLKVTDRLKGVPGFQNLEEIIIRKINQGAEDAAKTAGPIFVEAIRQMTIQDALGILKGDNNAATSYLQRTTYQNLYNEFNPVISTSLDKFDAQKIWADAANAYNNFPLTRQPVNTNLADHVTQRALEGLFRKVALEEENIRQNISARSSELLRRVFALQDGERSGQ
ncbi:DUF4197 domain-containing protein [Neolewinella lacunae]|uniref:DUF4197 domain-containing protein n=1 Tax=Neolewinella lacunae TaxID=1517758 RepID=A0A923PEN9_9BACT|nr:DUF4197 domain-containing protein [Neolewinella lacunae]MBC6992672.1 DUF4197 domain-containing protein [Neolewinella lacunae]MDN3633552.1 DUF4197 domain-containing protein [Neolewinella lacunae]